MLLRGLLLLLLRRCLAALPHAAADRTAGRADCRALARVAGNRTDRRPRRGATRRTAAGCWLADCCAMAAGSTPVFCLAQASH
jgi:hypothetical protein